MKKYFSFVVIFIVLFSNKAHSQTINWEKNFPSAQAGKSVQTLTDGGYIAAGGLQTGSILRTNSHGDSLWVKTYTEISNSLYFYAIKSVSDGYIVSGTNNSRPFLMKVDLNGTLLWSKTIGDPNTYGAIHSFALVPNGIMCTGYLYVGNDNQLLLAKFSMAGDSLWVKSVTGHTTTSGRAITKSTGNSIINSGGNCVITGVADTEIYLLKIDANGERLWDRCYGGIHSKSDKDEGKSVQATADGGFIICGGKALSNTSFNTEITLIKTTSDGTISWQKSLPGSGGYGHQILVESDCYIIAATVGGSSRVGHIFKTDLSGEVIHDKQLSTNYLTGVDKATDGSYTVVGTIQSPYSLYLGNISMTTTTKRYFVVRDANNNPLVNKDVFFYKGTARPGNDERLGGRTTDATGRIEIIPDWYKDGDNIRAVIEAGIGITNKPLHTDSIIQGVAYKVLLDNVKFDERTSLPLTEVKFDKYNADSSVTEQILTLNHTTLLFDVMISVEWDASETYLQEMENGMMLVSNYLYDVYDGQVALGRIAIYDDYVNSDGADICYLASSETWPNAGIQGFRNSRLGQGEQVFMPPRWFGSPDRTRNTSTSDTWLSMFVEDTWRTFAHELGHQLIGFRDEYSTATGASISDNRNLGFMDSHYSDSTNNYSSNLDKIYSSELSSANRYRTEDMINKQYSLNSSDCWTYFEQQFEKTYEGVFCPIVKPSERNTLATGTSWLIGPNDNNYSGPAYDVSSFTKVTIINKNTPLNEVMMRVWVPTTPTETPANLVRGYLTKKSSGRLIDLGKTNGNGLLRFLGAELGDSYMFSGFIGGKVSGQAVSLNGTFSTTRKGDSKITAMDSSVILNFVKGEYRIVPISGLQGATDFSLKLKMNTGFTKTPTAVIPQKSGQAEQLSFIYDGGSTTYETHIDSLPGRGDILITGYDQVNSEFMIPFLYSTSTFSRNVYGSNAAVEVLLDSSNATAIEKITIISSDFATLLNGLEPNVEQAGNVHSVILHPSAAALTGTNALTIKYSNSDLMNNSATSLQIFKWNENTSIWEKIGGSVDTAHQEVNAKITSAGTYAAFTTGSSTGVLEDDQQLHDITLSSVSESSGTVVHLDLPGRENVTITITNSLGILMTTLASGELTAGEHDFQMNTSPLPSGIYFCTAKTMNTTKTIKIMVIK